MTRILLALVAVVSFAAVASPPAVAATPAGACADYDGDAVSLRGTITLETFPGPPNFASLHRGDEPITEFVLALDTPICVNGQPDGEGGPLPALAAVTRVQAKMPTDAPVEAFLLGRLGEKVWLHGELLPPTNRYHYLPVLLQATRMTPAVLERPTLPTIPGTGVGLSPGGPLGGR